MSAITILTSAAQNDSGTGAAVDVTAYNTLRLNWAAVADLGMQATASLRLFIDTAPSASGPWTTIYERQLDANGWELSPRVTLSGFDSFVRARWDGKFPRSGEQQRTSPITKVFTVGLTGEAT